MSICENQMYERIYENHLKLWQSNTLNENRWKAVFINGRNQEYMEIYKNKETKETHRRSMEIKGDLRKSMNVNEQTGAPVLQICSVSIQVGAPASQICKRPTSQIRNRYKQTGAPVSKTNSKWESQCCGLLFTSKSEPQHRMMCNTYTHTPASVSQTWSI